jgi:hypothetical protein
MRATRAFWWVAIIAFASACSPGSPSSPTGNFSGTWQVHYLVTGGGHIQNTFLSGYTADTIFRLVQTNNDVSGVMFGIDVSGTIGRSGDVALFGLKEAAGPEDTRIEVSHVSFRLINNALTGTFQTSTTWYRRGQLYDNLTEVAQILTANHVTGQ